MIPLVLPPSVAQWSLASSTSDSSFAVSLNASGDSLIARIGGGAMFVNGKYVTNPPNQIPPTGYTEQKVEKEQYVYMKIENIFDRTKTPSLSFEARTDSPLDYTQPTFPISSEIPLAFIDKDGVVRDLRPKYIIDVFSILA